MQHLFGPGGRYTWRLIPVDDARLLLADLPVEEDRSQPIEIMRQVQIAAGSLVLLGVILGLTVAPGWFALSGFVGAGLVFAGTTGWCGMAYLLAIMPWNRQAAAA